MIRAFSVVVFLLIASCSYGPAFAADFYVCNTAENTGSDANDGSLASPWLSIDKALTELNSFNGGDNLYFCEGYDATSTANNVIASAGTCANATPCTVDRYTPAGQNASDNGVLPKLTNITFNVLRFSGDVLEDGGYVFNNIHLVGSSAVDCLEISNGFSTSSFNNVTFDSCSMGVDIEVTANQVSKEIDIINPTFINIADIGYRGSSSRGSIQGGTMTNVGNSSTDHAILLQGINTQDFTIKDIIITDTAHVGGVCSSPVVKGEGSFRGLYFDEMHINESEGQSAPACIGVLLDGDYGAEAANFNFVMFAKVTTAWTGTSGIACSNCTNVYGDHNIVIGDDAITTAIDIPYGVETGVTSDYVDMYKNYIVLKDADTGRSALAINTTRGMLTKNQVFLNNVSDICWNINSGIALDDNVCKQADVTGLIDSTNTVVN